MIIYFKSNPFFFYKEKSGQKPNTIRKVGDNDTRFDDLLEMIQTREYGQIVIKNNKTGEEFTRQITDVSYYDENFIISWRHQDDLKRI